MSEQAGGRTDRTATLPADVRKTATLLSDGRELFYFDEPQTQEDRGALVDTRQLPPSEPSSTVRLDRALGEWVTIAGHRQTRTHLPPDDKCPLCPSTAHRQSEIPARDYDVVVFQNRIPSFAQTSTVDFAPTRGARSADGASAGAGGFEALFAEGPGVGRCEVVCFTSDHDAAFSSLPRRRARTVIEAWVDRTRALSELPDVEQVFCFENRGEEIGVTLSHPHGQIYGYPFVTPRTTTMLDNARAYRERTGANLFADLLRKEIELGERVVVRSAHWTAFVPFAARWPIEVHISPTRQVPDLPALTDAERDDLSEIYLDVLRRMEGVHADSLPYIAAWHQAPVRVDRDLAYLHVELFSIRRAPGKLKYLAGSESAMGAWIGDIPPETAAAALRDAVASIPEETL